MELRNLGSSGLRVSAVGLGCNNFGNRIDFEQTRAVVGRALDLGITLFDTADTYGKPTGQSEAFIGRSLGAQRRNVVLATKFGQPVDDSAGTHGGSRRYIMSAVEASLRRLHTEWIDLYQLHRPDPLTPIEETLRALEDLVRDGKVRYIGSSKFAGWQMVEAHWTARHHNLGGFVSTQHEYSLLARGAEREILPAARACGAGFLPFFPLAAGLLTGKYRRDAIPAGSRLTEARTRDSMVTEERWRTLEGLRGFCEQRGRTLLELAVSWLLAQAPVSSVIAGATRPEQLEQNVAAAGWHLSAGDLAEIDRLTSAV